MDMYSFAPYNGIRLRNLCFEIASQEEVLDLFPGTNRRPQPKNGNQNTIPKSYGIEINMLNDTILTSRRRKYAVVVFIMVL